jgi:hypothetical protein
MLKVTRALTSIMFDFQKDKPTNTAYVSFGILEPNDGAALQVTCAGPKDAKLEFHGATLGARSPTSSVVTDYSHNFCFSPLEEVVSRNKLFLSVLFLWFVLGVVVMFTPFIRNFIYRNLFRSKETDQQIESSAMRILIPMIIFLSFLGLSLIRTPEVTTEVPSVLIVKDLSSLPDSYQAWDGGRRISF